MVDVQEELETRNIYLRKVGIKDFIMPVMHDLDHKYQNSIGTIAMGVSLDADKHAIHMSRLVESLYQWDSKITNESIKELLSEVKKRLEARSAHIGIEFTYFKDKIAPSSKQKGTMNYNCKVQAELLEDGSTDFKAKVRVPIGSVCPCSKAISEYGAHNQRGIVEAAFRGDDIGCLNDVVNKIEAAASTQLYSLLKRVDEKYVTENAYENAKFVEDIARDVTIHLMKDPKYSWFQVEVENYESIHNHNAYAVAGSEDAGGINGNE